MKTHQIIALAFLAVATKACVDATDYQPSSATPSRIVLEDVPVNADLPIATSTNVIEVTPVVITVQRARRTAPRGPVVQRAECGAFAPRELTQGHGTVRGFCS